jgi:hypothetical protein
VSALLQTNVLPSSNSLVSEVRNEYAESPLLARCTVQVECQTVLPLNGGKVRPRAISRRNNTKPIFGPDVREYCQETHLVSCQQHNKWCNQLRACDGQASDPRGCQNCKSRKACRTKVVLCMQLGYKHSCTLTTIQIPRLQETFETGPF